MKNTNQLAIIFSVIAILLSLVSIYLTSTSNNQNFVIQDQLNQKHALISTALQTSDFVDFERDLVYYQDCINNAIKNYIACVEFKQGNCETNFNEARNFCDNDLKNKFGI